MTDRLTIAMVSLAAFLIVLALLATQLGHAGTGDPAARAVLVRRIYETTVVERVPAASSGAGPSTSSVTQSVSASGAPPATPVTRTS
jgi:hypothetical protein